MIRYLPGAWACPNCQTVKVYVLSKCDISDPLNYVAYGTWYCPKCNPPKEIRKEEKD